MLLTFFFPHGCLLKVHCLQKKKCSNTFAIIIDVVTYGSLHYIFLTRFDYFWSIKHMLLLYNILKKTNQFKGSVCTICC